MIARSHYPHDRLGKLSQEIDVIDTANGQRFLSLEAHVSIAKLTVAACTVFLRMSA